MKPPQKRPPVRLVEDNEAPTEGDFEFYRARRRAKYGPAPRSTKGVPLIREKLTSREFEVVVGHSLDRPKQIPWAWGTIAIVISFSVICTLATLVGVAARTMGR